MQAWEQRQAGRETYPEEDADGTGHADLSHPHHRHLVPGGLGRPTGQGGDQFLHDRRHDPSCAEKETQESESGDEREGV